MVLVQKQKYRPMEKERKPRNKPYGYLIFSKEEIIYNREKIVSSINGAGKTGQLHVKNEIRTLLNTICKDKFKMD